MSELLVGTKRFHDLGSGDLFNIPYSSNMPSVTKGREYQKIHAHEKQGDYFRLWVNATATTPVYKGEGRIDELVNNWDDIYVNASEMVFSPPVWK